MAAAARIFAAALVVAAACAQAAELGTLFHSPEERERLDRLRRGESPERVAAPMATPEVTGYVKRSDGRHTVWINGIGVAVRDPKAAPVLDPGSVRGYADRDESDLKVERRPAR